MSIRFHIAALLSIVVNAVVFGIGAITVLSVPSLALEAKMLLPLCVATSLIVAPPILGGSRRVCRNRYWRQRTPTHV